MKTEREKQIESNRIRDETIIRMAKEGRTSTEIGKKLNLSANWVWQVAKKLGVRLVHGNSVHRLKENRPHCRALVEKSVVAGIEAENGIKFTHDNDYYRRICDEELRKHDK